MTSDSTGSLYVSCKYLKASSTHIRKHTKLANASMGSKLEFQSVKKSIEHQELWNSQSSLGQECVLLAVPVICVQGREGSGDPSGPLRYSSSASIKCQAGKFS